MNVMEVRRLPSSYDDDDEESFLYGDQTGTSIAISAGDCILVASDTRFVRCSQIACRNMQRIFGLNDLIFTFSGFFPDGNCVYKAVCRQSRIYKSKLGYEINANAVFGFTHCELYKRRFFPFGARCIICGWHNGIPKIAHYDEIGSFDVSSSASVGPGGAMIQPVLDGINLSKLNRKKAIMLVRKCFDSLCNKEIRCGDFLDVWILKNDGDLEKLRYELRAD